MMWWWWLAWAGTLAVMTVAVVFVLRGSLGWFLAGAAAMAAAAVLNLVDVMGWWDYLLAGVCVASAATWLVLWWRERQRRWVEAVALVGRMETVEALESGEYLWGTGLTRAEWERGDLPWSPRVWPDPPEGNHVPDQPKITGKGE